MRTWRYVILGLLFVNLIVVLAQTSTTESSVLDDDNPFVEIPLSLSSDSLVTIDHHAVDGDLDTLLYLVDASGIIVAENDDRARGDYNALIDQLLVPSGDYTVVATRYGVLEGETSGQFELTIETASPEGALSYAVGPDDLLAAGFPEIDPLPDADWTILAYYGGDTNLEAAILNDLNEFELGGGSDQTVRVLALVDRHPEFSKANGDWRTVRVFEVGADVTGDELNTFPPTIDTEPLFDLGVQDSGSGDLLAQFISWAMRQYPAAHYAVAFGGHGGGWVGLATDDSAAGSIITMKELEGAFASVTAAMKLDSSFDLLINDACLMSSIEYYGVMAPYFKTSIASPEIVVDPALDMTELTELLRLSPGGAPSEVGVVLVDTYMDRDVQQRPGPEAEYLSAVVTDLTAFDPVAATVETFADVVLQDVGRYSALLGLARSNVYTFIGYADNDDTIDLGHLMQQVIVLSGDAEIVAAARDVLEALETSRVYARAGSLAERFTSYYNIYFPEESANFDVSYLVQSPLPRWGQMLQGYYNAVSPRLWLVEDSILTYHPPLAPKVTVTQVYPETASTAFPPSVALEVVGKNLAEGAFTVDRLDDDGNLQRLLETSILTEAFSDDAVDLINHWKSGVDLSFFNWLPLNLPVVSDGENAYNELLLKTGDAVVLEGRYREPGAQEWRDVSVLFDLEGNVTEVISRASAVGTVAVVDITDGSEFQAYRFDVVDDGDTKATPGNLYTWGENGLTWGDEPTPSGSYDLGFIVRTFGGTTGFDKMSITIENDEIDALLRGYTEIELGINFQRPVDWSPVIDYGNRLESVAPDDRAVLAIHYLPAREGLYDILAKFEGTRPIQRLNAARPVTIGGIPALEMAYTFTNLEGTDWVGRAFATFRKTPVGGRGVIFTVEAFASQPEVLEETYIALRDTVVFFDAAELARSSDRTWRYGFLGRRVPFPVPVSWTRTDAPPWRVFTAPDGVSTAEIAEFRNAETESVFEEIATALTDAGIETEQRSYAADDHTWQTLAYQRERDGVDVYGRVYVTRQEHTVYAMRFETPTTDDAYILFRDYFEPMVDGFSPSTTVSFANQGTSTTLLKAALVQAEAICDDLQPGELCAASGIVSPTFSEGAAVASRPTLTYNRTGETQGQLKQTETTVENLAELAVGLLPDGGFDPYSVAVYQLQANLPEQSAGAQIFVFGGATIENHAVVEGGLISALELTNISGQRINIRHLATTQSLVLGSLGSGESVTAIARLEDSSWIQILLPDDNNRAGWVLAALLSPSLQIDNLPVNSGDAPYYHSMQNIEVFLSDANLDGVSPYGVLIKTPEDPVPLVLKINDVTFEVGPNSLVFWDGETESLEDAELDGTGEVLLVSKRRPGTWSAEVLSGALRIRIDDPSLLDGYGGGASVVTAIGGTSAQFNERGTDPPQLRPGGPIGGNILPTFNNFRDVPPLNQDDVDDLGGQQDLLNDLELGDAGELPYYFNDKIESEDADEDEGITDYLLNETDYTGPNTGEPEEGDDGSGVTITEGAQFNEYGWGLCGSCEPCGGPTSECILSPDGTCIWDQIGCKPAPPPTQPPISKPPLPTEEPTPELPPQQGDPGSLGLPDLVSCSYMTSTNFIVDLLVEDGSMISSHSITPGDPNVAELLSADLIYSTSLSVDVDCLSPGTTYFDIQIIDSFARVYYGTVMIEVY